jgi:hypothetical protein
MVLSAWRTASAALGECGLRSREGPLEFALVGFAFSVLRDEAGGEGADVFPEGAEGLVGGLVVGDELFAGFPIRLGLDAVAGGDEVGFPLEEFVPGDEVDVLLAVGEVDAVVAGIGADVDEFSGRLPEDVVLIELVEEGGGLGGIDLGGEVGRAAVLLVL